MWCRSRYSTAPEYIMNICCWDAMWIFIMGCNHEGRNVNPAEAHWGDYNISLHSTPSSLNSTSVITQKSTVRGLCSFCEGRIPKSNIYQKTAQHTETPLSGLFDDVGFVKTIVDIYSIDKNVQIHCCSNSRSCVVKAQPSIWWWNWIQRRCEATKLHRTPPLKRKPSLFFLICQRRTWDVGLPHNHKLQLANDWGIYKIICQSSMAPSQGEWSN